MAGPTILLSAGEPSGDLHGARVVRALRQRWPDARLIGLGGPRMAAEGFEPLAEFDRLAVMGFVEVVTHLPYFIGLLRRVLHEIETREVDLVLPIDYPGFNLRLARGARARDVPVLYYIAPQVWAWHRSRMRDLAENADRLAVILPFEAELMRSAGADARYVGHPLLDRDEPVTPRAELCRQLALDPERPILALFPGSRAQEVERHLGPFTGAARLLQQERPELQAAIAASSGLPESAYAGAPYARTEDSRALLAHARAALVKSGTTTLEAAIEGTPMVVAYRTHPLTFWLAQRLVEVDHVGLVNLVADERLAPELLQNEVEPEPLARAVAPLLEEHSGVREQVTDGLARVRERLRPQRAESRRSAAERVADLAAELLPT